MSADKIADNTVMPGQAGIQCPLPRIDLLKPLDARLRGHDDAQAKPLSSICAHRRQSAAKKDLRTKRP
ncbi:hypothetical protein [Luteimonas suaedae]|uniref:hypothetical protein n=1 Tax=Luteimonas suaedae TaxID=2605430 RepID=UPI0011EBB457|nr:hypothetical protein [Luteimonas suaedae]